MHKNGWVSVTNVCLGLLLAAMPILSGAQDYSEESCQSVVQSLEVAAGPAAVISAVVAGGMTLTDATLFVMSCGDEESRASIATAGLELAGSRAQAKSVAAAVVTSYGETSPEAVAVRQASKAMDKTAKQPQVYESDYVPHGGAGVSPST